MWSMWQPVPLLCCTTTLVPWSVGSHRKVTEKSRIVTGAKCKLHSAPLWDCVTTNYIGYTVLGRRKGMTSLNVSIYTGLQLPIQIEQGERVRDMKFNASDVWDGVFWVSAESWVRAFTPAWESTEKNTSQVNEGTIFGFWNVRQSLSGVCGFNWSLIIFSSSLYRLPTVATDPVPTSSMHSQCLEHSLSILLATHNVSYCTNYIHNIQGVI